MHLKLVGFNCRRYDNHILYARLMGYTNEQPTPTIKEYVKQQVRTHQVDMVFLHTCPFKYVPTKCFLPGIDQSTVDNSTEHWLDTIEEMLDYQAWYLGHWHINKRIDKLHFLMYDVEMPYNLLNDTVGTVGNVWFHSQR